MFAFNKNDQRNINHHQSLMFHSNNIINFYHDLDFFNEMGQDEISKKSQPIPKNRKCIFSCV